MAQLFVKKGDTVVVRLDLRGPPDRLAVSRVLDPVLDLDRDRLVHLVADDVTLAGLAEATSGGLGCGLGAGAHVCCLLGHASALLSSAVSTVPMPSSRSRMTV